MLCPKDLSNARAISHGKGQLKVARKIYARNMQQQVPGFPISDAGNIFIQNFLILMQTQMEKCLIHHQAANYDYWR